MKGRHESRSRARALRKEASDAEHVLWQHLRDRRMMGRKFRRQVAIDPYIVDFLCLEERLIVEADGGQHAEQKAYDRKRTAALEAKGYRVMRFWNHEILTELDAVLEQIRITLVEQPSPQPSPAGGRGS
ncbi:MAG: endonuclease domain-containing protein [Arenicellales bacterium]